jgi:hypothetical protein
MAQIVLIRISVIVIGAISWGMGRLIDAMRSREHIAERLLIDDC